MDKPELTTDALLAKREYDFQIFTKRIIERFAEKLTKATQYYLKTDRNIHWYKIERLSHLHNYVTLTGDLELQPGDLLDTEQGQVVITETNMKRYSNVFRAIVPLRLLDKGDSRMIEKHIRELAEMSKKLRGDELVLYLEQLDAAAMASETIPVADEGELMKNEKYEAILERITKPEQVEGFKTEDLNEAQVQQVKLLAATTRRMN